MDHREVKEIVTERVGFCPKDAVGWLYAARGFYKMKDYNLVIQAVSHCLRSRKTLKEAQHLLGFSLMHTGQTSAAVAAFLKSVKLGNDTDWQPLIELCVDNPTLQVTQQ